MPSSIHIETIGRLANNDWKTCKLAILELLQGASLNDVLNRRNPHRHLLAIRSVVDWNVDLPRALSPSLAR